MTNFKDKVIHSLENATHKIDEISHKIDELTHKIADHFLPARERIEHYLKEKGIENTTELRQGKEHFNVLANSDGSFVTNNDVALSRSLINLALFTEDGEKRLSDAMANEKNPILRKVETPKKEIQPTKISQLTNNQIF